MSTPGGHDGGPRDDLARIARLRETAEQGRDGVRARAQRLNAWLETERQKRTVLDVGMRLHERDQEAAGTVAGSAVAFRLFLFFVPTLLVIVAVAGFAAKFIATDVTDNAGVTGVVATQIETAFNQPSTTRWTALLFGLLGMASAGRSLAKALVLVSSLSWRVPPRQKATVRISAIIVGVMVGVALVTTIVNRIRKSVGIGVAGVAFVGVAVVYLVAWAALLLTLPRSTKDPGSVLPGAALMALALSGLQAVTQFYIPNRLDHASDLYGGIGVTIVTLGWFFIIGRAAVFSMTLNAVIFERLGSVSSFIFGLPVLRILPAKSTGFAQFFGLNEGAGEARPVPGDGAGDPPGGDGTGRGG